MLIFRMHWWDALIHILTMPMRHRLKTLVICASAGTIWYAWDAIVLTLVQHIEKPVIFSSNCVDDNDLEWTAECGHLFTDLDPSGEIDETVRIPFLYLKSKNRKKSQPPVIFVNGGPGGLTYAGQNYAEAWIHLLHAPELAWLEDQDLIVFSQRGLPDTIPALTCPTYDVEEPIDFDYNFETGFPLAHWFKIEEQRINECLDHMIKDNQLIKYYDTNTIVSDLHALIAELNVGKSYLWGTSYGSRIALEFARRHENILQGLILEGVAPPGIHEETDHTDIFPAILEQVIHRCEQSEKCQYSGHQLRENFKKRLTGYLQAPTRIEFRSKDRKFKPAVMDHVLLLELIWYSLLSADGIKNAEKLMYGEIDSLSEQLAELEYSFINLATQMTISCNDAVWNQWRSLSLQKPYNAAFSDWTKWGEYWFTDLCQIWRQAASTTAETSEVVKTSTPTLMLNGSLDPATPVQMMWEQLEHLPNGWAYEFPNEGHFVSHDLCAQRIMKNFLVFPTLDPDHTCVAYQKIKTYEGQLYVE